MKIDDYSNVINRLEISEKCRDEVLNMETKTISHKKIRKSSIAIIVAAAVLALGGTAVFAAEQLGLFDRLAEIRNRKVISDAGVECRLDKFDTNNCAEIGKSAKPLDVPVEAVSENLTVYAESVYCDGQNLIIGLTGFFNNDNTDNDGCITFDADVTVNGKTYSSSNIAGGNGFYRFEGRMFLDEGFENAFTGSLSLTLAESDKISGASTVGVRLYNIRRSRILLSDNFTALDDELNMNIEIAPEESLVENCQYQMSQDGYTAKIYEITPAMITVGSKYPEFYDTNTETITLSEGETGPKYSIIDLWYDDKGNMLKGIPVTDYPDYGDNMNIGFLASCDTKALTVKWMNKQQQDENGNPVVVYEYTFVLDNK